MQSCIRTRSYIGPITPTPNRPFSVPSIRRWSEKSIAITQHRNYPTPRSFRWAITSCLFSKLRNCQALSLYVGFRKWYGLCNVSASDSDSNKNLFGILELKKERFTRHLFGLVFFRLPEICTAWNAKLGLKVLLSELRWYCRMQNILLSSPGLVFFLPVNAACESNGLTGMNRQDGCDGSRTLTYLWSLANYLKKNT